MMKKDITLSDIAGYATERMVWQMMLDLLVICDYDRNVVVNDIVPKRITVADNHFLLQKTGTSGNGDCRAFSAPEFFFKNFRPSTESNIWTIGALAFYAITGTDVLEGKGGETQTKNTEIPRLSSAHASKELSTLIFRCLSYLPTERPTKEEIQEQAQTALSQTIVPRKRLSSQMGKGYGSSLVKFWPEEMVPTIIVWLFLLLTTGVFAQTPKFDKTAIPNEMVSLVLRCTDLRSPQNVAKVRRAMEKDMNWTMMDELSIDKRGECTTKDLVDTFGLNEMGFSILKRHNGVTNAGGRFRDGRDPRYKFSFIEITVKRGKKVNYKIIGREGEQIFAIVPFEKNAYFHATIENKKKKTEGQIVDGVCYMRLKQGIKPSDAFYLSLENLSSKNMAFVIVNYNSRNNE